MFLFILLSIIVLFAVFMYLQYRKLCTFRKNSNYLKAIAYNIPIAMYIRDLKGNIIFANEPFAKVTGLSKKELETKNIKEVFSKEDVSTIQNEDEQILKTKKSIFLETAFTFDKDSDHHYVLLKTPVINSKNEVTGFLILFRNIDKQKKLESEKESFIATLTHDLKSPTYAQMNVANMLLEGKFGALLPEQSEMLKLLKSSCEYVSELVATILDTYKCDNGMIQLKPSEFDIVFLVESLRKGFECVADEKKQKIFFTHDEDTCIIRADRLQIKRVIYNFLSNAITYGFRSTSIELKVKKINDEIEFSVTNKSKQITDSELATMFERFKQTGLSRFNNVSTGLGLYLSKQIIELHKGKVFAESDEDGTCVFGFRIPINEIKEIIPKTETQQQSVKKNDSDKEDFEKDLFLSESV